MSRRALLALLGALALGACAAHERRLADAPVLRAAERTVPLPPRGHLSGRADVFRGPRVMTGTTHRRAVAMHGDTDARSRLLIAGCVNGERCAGTDVVHTATVGCPPPDAELWFFASLDPGGADLDATPAHPGAAAWRQAVADLEPRTVITFRTGPHTTVRAAGRSTRAARRFAPIARLPYGGRVAVAGLAAWTAAVRPETAAIVVELPAGRASAPAAVRIAYAIDRLAGTRFAAGGLEERRAMIRHGRDPRM